MDATTALLPRAPSATHPAREPIRLGWLIVGAVVLGLVLAGPLVGAVLSGNFGDPDDAMRLVEVRAWLDGQPWFDMTAHRLDPPLGASMHWSRLVDLPTALLIRLFEWATDKAHAEGLAAVAVPTLYLALLALAMAHLATVLMGRAARGLAVFGLLASGVTLVQVQPGRIGHHAPETVALVFAVAAVLAAFDPARSRQAAWAGGLVALSLAMSLETLPFLAVLIAALVLAWVIEGAAMASALAWFGGALAVALPVFFLATVGPDHWFASVCDAYGAPQASAGLVGALGLCVLARVTPSSWPLRLVGAGILGAVVLAVIALAYPACLHSPFAGVDPLVRAIWLDSVVESMPLTAFIRTRPMAGLMIVGPLTLGMLGCLWAVVATEETTRLRFAALALLAASGLALGFWQVRVYASVAPLALCGGLFFVEALRRRLAARGLGLVALAAILPFTSTAWALLLPNDGAAATADGGACLSRQALVPLASLPPGRVVAPVDAGSHILEATALDVFAAPYHRDNDGNRFTLDVFLAPPAQAVALLASRHVAYVMTCPGLGETAALARRAPDSLADALVGGRVPDGLKTIPLAATPYRVYAVTPPASD